MELQSSERLVPSKAEQSFRLLRALMRTAHGLPIFRPQNAPEGLCLKTDAGNLPMYSQGNSVVVQGFADTLTASQQVTFSTRNYTYGRPLG
jgi:hypothetical protein